MQEVQNSGFQALTSISIPIPEQAIADFLRSLKDSRVYCFGSVLCDDFQPESSDIDVMIQFAPDSHWSLLEVAQMKYELEDLFDRKVDLLTKKSIEQSKNWLRRREILGTAQLLCVQR